MHQDHDDGTGAHFGDRYAMNIIYNVTLGLRRLFACLRHACIPAGCSVHEVPSSLPLSDFCLHRQLWRIKCNAHGFWIFFAGFTSRSVECFPILHFGFLDTMLSVQFRDIEVARDNLRKEFHRLEVAKLRAGGN